jgi:hypothetical protein
VSIPPVRVAVILAVYQDMSRPGKYTSGARPVHWVLQSVTRSQRTQKTPKLYWTCRICIFQPYTHVEVTGYGHPGGWSLWRGRN